MKLDHSHAEHLAKALEDGRPLDRLTVWATNGRLVLVDGHHRAEAYRRAGWQKPVPIFVFEGGITKAKIRTLTPNAKARLPLTYAERADAAWELVRLEDRPPLAEIAAAAAVSLRTAKNMSARLREMQTRKTEITGSWTRGHEGHGR